MDIAVEAWPGPPSRRDKHESAGPSGHAARKVLRGAPAQGHSLGWKTVMAGSLSGVERGPGVGTQSDLSEAVASKRP